MTMPLWKNKVTSLWLDDAIRLLKPKAFLAKVDLANAYRVTHIHKDDHEATGLQWWFSGHDKPTLMYDGKLMFGARRAPMVFQHLTQSVRRMMERKGFNNLIVYLDDWLIVEDSFDQCLRTMNTRISLLRRLGFQINWSKVEGPSQTMKFLGVIIDTVDMSLRLPEEKMMEFLTILHDFSQRRRVTR